MRLSGPKAPDDGPLPDDPEDRLPPISGPQSRPKPKRDAVSSPSNVDTNGPDRSSNVDKEPDIQPSPNVDNTTVNVDMRAVMSFSESDAIRGWWMGLKQEDPEIKDALIVLKRAREVLELHPPIPRAPTTARRYGMWVNRLKAEDTEPDKLAVRYAKKTAYVIRGAFIDDLLSNQLPDALSAGRAAIQDMDPDELMSAARDAERVMMWLTKYPPDRNGDQIRRLANGEDIRSFYDAARERAVAIHGPELELAVANPRLSRRNILSRLPVPDPNVSMTAKDWRDTFWESAVTTSHAEHNKAAFAILKLVPARPQEIADGIMVEVVGKKLALTVLYPAKSHHEKFGLGTRTHTMRIIGSAQAKWLADFAIANGGKVKVDVPRERLLEVAHEISAKAFPGVFPPVAPYDFRHQFSAEAKAIASDLFPGNLEAQREYVAVRMGHSSDKSQRGYGVSSQARGGASELDNVTLADPSRKVKLSKERSLSAFRQGPGRGVGI